MLPPGRFEQFEAEHRIILDNEVLWLAILVSDFAVHQTMASGLLKLTISEPCVERAFSRHKLVQSRLRVNISAE